jgi:hypothetical protein
MIYAEVAITIRRPRRDVAAVMFNPRFDFAWIGFMAGQQRTSLGPLRRGTKVHREWRLLGRRVPELCEVAEHVPDRCVEMVGQSRLAWRIRYELEGIPEGTIARVRTQASPSRRLRLFVPTINLFLRRAAIRDLDRLKLLIESGGSRALTG